MLRRALSAPDNVRYFAIGVVHIIKAGPTVVTRIFENVGNLLERRRPVLVIGDYFPKFREQPLVMGEHICNCR